jgi:hypothetical protein
VEDVAVGIAERGVYPSAEVTLVLVRLIVPLELVIFEPIFTPPRVEDVAVGTAERGVYPSAEVTFVLVMLIVPLELVMFEPIFTPPRVEVVAVGTVISDVNAKVPDFAGNYKSILPLTRLGGMMKAEPA